MKIRAPAELTPKKRSPLLFDDAMLIIDDQMKMGVLIQSKTLLTEATRNSSLSRTLCSQTTHQEEDRIKSSEKPQRYFVIHSLENHREKSYGIMSTTTKEKPPKTTMEGLIWHANEILQHAISEHGAGLPKDIVENCHGVVLMSTVEVGAIFTGTVGSGILLRKKPIAGMKWSPPCALKLHGAGFGLSIGGQHNDFLIFCLDNDSVRAMAVGKEFTFGAQNSHVLGHLGRTSRLDFNSMNNGVISVSFSDGAFFGVSLEGAKVTPNDKVNEHFYGQAVSADKILEGIAIKMPDDKVTLMDEVHAKLAILSLGETFEPDQDERAKVEAAKEEAHKAHDDIKSGPKVVEVAKTPDGLHEAPDLLKELVANDPAGGKVKSS